MKPELKKEMEENLIKEKARVEEELSRFAHRIKGENDVKHEVEYKDLGESEDDNATEVTNYSNNLSLESTLEKLLRDVTSALERMSRGEYGTCKYCSKEISEARLRARPTSSSCIECKKTLTQEA